MPTPQEFQKIVNRILATAFGKKAVDLIAAEQYDQLVVWRNGEVHSKLLEEVIPHLKQCQFETSWR